MNSLSTKIGDAMGNSEFLVVSNIFKEYSEKIPLNTVVQKLVKWLRHFNNTLVVWPHGPAEVSSAQPWVYHQVHNRN
jgi:hypothetical protein